MGALIPPPGQPGPMKPGEYVQPGPPNLVTFALRDVPPPSLLYIQRDDILAVEYIASQADTLVVTARLLLAEPRETGQPEGSVASQSEPPAPVQGALPIQSIQQTYKIPGQGTPTTVYIHLAEGYLLSVSAISTSATTRGMTFVRAFILRGIAPTGTLPIAEVLFADYVTQYQAIGWPGSPVRYPTEGPGEVASLIVSNPSAGADWSYGFWQYSRTLINSIGAVLTTSSTAGSRYVQIQIKDLAGHIIWLGSPSVAIAASTTTQCSFAYAPPATTLVSTNVFAPLPLRSFIQGAGYIGTVTSGIQSGDQWSAIYVSYEQWIDLA